MAKKSPRENRISILLNESEQRALDRFCERYGVTNRSKLVRETLMRAILKKIENDQPTLFD
jgi:metal-responsive CopG/Arc/MetJ family transcriptional regulator